MFGGVGYVFGIVSDREYLPNEFGIIWERIGKELGKSGKKWEKVGKSGEKWGKVGQFGKIGEISEKKCSITVMVIL